MRGLSLSESHAAKETVDVEQYRNERTFFPHCPIFPLPFHLAVRLISSSLVTTACDFPGGRSDKRSLPKSVRVLETFLRELRRPAGRFDPVPRTLPVTSFLPQRPVREAVRYSWT